MNSGSTREGKWYATIQGSPPDLPNISTLHQLHQERVMNDIRPHTGEVGLGTEECKFREQNDHSHCEAINVLPLPHTHLHT